MEASELEAVRRISELHAIRNEALRARLKIHCTLEEVDRQINNLVKMIEGSLSQYDSNPGKTDQRFQVHSHAVPGAASSTIANKTH